MINCVAKWRRFEAMTQQELSEICGISRVNLAAIEAGKTVPRIDTALKIAAALNRPVDALFSIQDEEPSQFSWIRPGLIREA